MMSQEEADQNVVDKVSEGVDSRDVVMQEWLVIFKEKWVGGWATVTTNENQVLCGVWREIKLYR